MPTSKFVYIVHAEDAEPHLGSLKTVLEELRKEYRIDGYATWEITSLSPGSFDKVIDRDMVILLLTNGILPERAGITEALKTVKLSQRNCKIAEIIVDNIPYDLNFLTFPKDFEPIGPRLNKESAWKKIGEGLTDIYPLPVITQPLPPLVPDKKGIFNQLLKKPRLLVWLSIPIVILIAVWIYLKLTEISDLQTFGIKDIITSVSEPSNFSGNCPHEFVFKSRIAVTGPGVIKYTWLSSDSLPSPEETFEFRRGDPLEVDVETSRKLGGDGQNHPNNWQQLKILFPKETLSNRAHFNLVCDPTTTNIFRVTGVTAEVTENAPVGSVFNYTACPHTFVFHGKIKVNTAGRVIYTWIRSDNAPVPQETVDFSDAGTKTVTTSWDFPDNGQSYLNNWVQLKIISPQELTSNKATFNLKCLGESCRTFDYNTLTVTPTVNKLYKITGGSASIENINPEHGLFFSSLENAEKAVNIIKFYRMTSFCVSNVKALRLSYFRVNDDLPVGPFPGEECVSINNPQNVTYYKREGHDYWYNIMDGEKFVMRAFNEEAAIKLVKQIKFYKPDYSCQVESAPDTWGMRYFRN